MKNHPNLNCIVSQKGGIYVDGEIINKEGDENGYQYVCVDGIQKFIHVLVAETYLPNSDNLPEVNHLDCNKANNCVGNLEWTDRKGNMEHASNHRRMSKEEINKQQKYRKWVNKDFWILPS
jgi:hypothetical protein